MVTAGILTISDKGWRGEREDESGRVIRECLDLSSVHVLEYDIVPDEGDVIADKLRGWADGGKLDLIVTTGGTGLSPRDVAPEATLAIVEKVVPGLTEAMRAESLKKTPTAMLSRAIAGIRGRCLIINLPGSPKAVRECLEVVLPAIPHAVETMKGEAWECAERATTEEFHDAH